MYLLLVGMKIKLKFDTCWVWIW